MVIGINIILVLMFLHKITIMFIITTAWVILYHNYFQINNNKSAKYTQKTLFPISK